MCCLLYNQNGYVRYKKVIIICTVISFLCFTVYRFISGASGATGVAVLFWPYVCYAICKKKFGANNPIPEKRPIKEKRIAVETESKPKSIESVDTEHKIRVLKTVSIVLGAILVIIIIVFCASWSNAQDQLYTKNDEIYQLSSKVTQLQGELDKTPKNAAADIAYLEGRVDELKDEIKLEYRRGYENGFTIGVSAEHSYISGYTGSNSIDKHATFFDTYGLPDELYFDEPK